MANVYPLLYMFENSARDVINRVLTDAIGTDWWGKIAANGLAKKVVGRQKDEGRDAWHSQRGAHPIYYLDLPDLPPLVNHQLAWPHFKGLFTGRQNWFDGVVDDLNVSRRVVAHMNPLTREDIQQVEAGVNRWARQLKSVQDKLPS